MPFGRSKHLSHRKRVTTSGISSDAPDNASSTEVAQRPERAMVMSSGERFALFARLAWFTSYRFIFNIEHEANFEVTGESTWDIPEIMAWTKVPYNDEL